MTNTFRFSFIRNFWQWFTRPCTNQHRFAVKVVLQAEHIAHCFDNRFQTCQPARSRHPASQVTLVRVDHADASRAQHPRILLRRGMLPHVDVHRRRHNHWSFRRQV